MENRRVQSCRRCGLQLSAPPMGAKTIYCPRCQLVTQLQPRNTNIYGAPTVNANGVYNNINPVNTGVPASYPARPGRNGFGYANYRPQPFQMSPHQQIMSPKPQMMSPPPQMMSPKPSPQPQMMSPQPQMMSPKPQMMSPPPQMMSPKPSPQPQMMSPQPQMMLPQPQMMSPQPQMRSPPVFGRKRAVLCGVNYRGHNKSLKGSINDVLAVRHLLVEKFGFPNASVIILTEDEKDPFRIPTKANIRTALRWLVKSCQPGDSLVFFYSGHGSRVRDVDGDEVDGYDESLCPIDFETEGRILDDEINETIVRPLPHGVTLHSIIDACYAGTFLDLQFMCRINRGGGYMWEDHRTPYGKYKGTRGGIAISIGACDDHQSSGDTIAFTGFPTGALTYSFVKTLEQEPKLTYGRLLLSMHNKIHETQKGIGLNGKDVTQEPQLASSERFDIHSKLLVL